MLQISKVEISYFRSIYYSAIKGLGDLSVICGKNDVGKSNYLRALNLFFNGHTDWKTPLDFYRDFNLHRLQECRDSIKGKQFIRVKVHFIRGNRYENSLPDKFWVSKTWSRDGVLQVKNSLTDENIKATTLDRAQASLQRYLNTIHYEYVPAVKDRTFFSHSLGRLQDAVMKSRTNGGISAIVGQLNDAVVEEVKGLKSEFKSVAGVDVEISLPENLSELFSAFSLSSSGSDIPFISRGDGIQARFIPSLLHHISEQSNLHFVWGFEEPENCMEHALCSRLADDMECIYSKNAQILITSHSPAFLDLKEQSSRLFKVSCDDIDGTYVEILESASLENFSELGLLALQRKFQKEYEDQIETSNAAKNVLERMVDDSNKPVLLVEGKTDQMILEEAERRLYDDALAGIHIKSCSTTDDDGSAGCGILKKALESVRPDMQVTIGLFDHDREGLEAFEKLDKNFCHHDKIPDVKSHRNGRAFAMIIPSFDGVSEYAAYRNLSIEFLFPDSALTRKHGGNGLEFTQKRRIVAVDGVKSMEEDTTEPWHRRIVNGKVVFAEKIVPRLADKDFEGFGPLFDVVDQILSSMDE
jgi:AAA15 family ATPase/GTPase